jgi:inner membrane transporter RhtA
MAMGSVSAQMSTTLAPAVFRSYGVVGTAGVRLLVAAVVIGVVCRTRRASYHSLRDALRVGLLLGLALIGLNVGLYEAIARIPLGTAVTLMILGPLAVSLAASRRRRDIAAVILAGVGVVLIVGVQRPSSLTGVAWAMEAAASIVGYLLVIRRLGQRARGLEGVAIGVAVGAVALLPVTVGALGRTEHVTTALAACVLGVAGLVVPLVIEAWAVRVLTVRVVSLMLTLDPVVAAVGGWLVLGQALGIASITGIACVISAAGVSIGSLAAAARAP